MTGLCYGPTLLQDIIKKKVCCDRSELWSNCITGDKKRQVCCDRSEHKYRSNCITGDKEERCIWTGTIPKVPQNQQVLDRLQVERERGITVKAQTASLIHAHNGKLYLLNLIDTPVGLYTHWFASLCIYLFECAHEIVCV